MTASADTGRDFPSVVFDLFGTLVDAPTEIERCRAARAVAGAAGICDDVVLQVLSNSWLERHDGRLPTTRALCDFLWRSCGAAGTVPLELRDVLMGFAAERLVASEEVLGVLRDLRRQGVRVGVLSDASADIAEAWPHSALSEVVDTAVFSCRAGAVKPAVGLYEDVVGRLGVAPEDALFCGDGGGDELRGAERAGLTSVRVERRGGPTALAFGEQPWPGPCITGVERLPSFVFASRAPR
ncbi:HAD family hydrolase [Streptomyces avidinii]|uniref:HAD family hydrolase n=1 Tax=Streptomyces avidinii TaxID=1895 RepID=UPI0037A3CF17